MKWCNRRGPVNSRLISYLLATGSYVRPSAPYKLLPTCNRRTILPSLVRLGLQLSCLMHWPCTVDSTLCMKALCVPPRGRCACPVLVTVRLTLVCITGMPKLPTWTIGRREGMCL